MGLKTNELQQLAAVLGTDTLLADTAAAGTGRVSIAQLAEFLANGDGAVKAALINKATLGDAQWHDLPLAEGYQSWYTRSQYRKDGMGIVHLVLSVRTVDNEICENGAIIATLPEGYRPSTPFWYHAYDLFNPDSQRIRFEVDSGNIIIENEAGIVDVNGWRRVGAYVAYLAG